MLQHCTVVALAFLVGLLGYVQSFAYDGYKMFEVVPDNREQCDLLFELSQKEELYDFFSLSKLPQHPAHVMVTPKEEKRFIRILKSHQIAHKVLDENVGRSIETEMRKNSWKRMLQPSFDGKGRLSTDRYYTHDEINNYIADLARRYPSRAFIKTVGRSYEGRWLKTLTITNGDGRANKNVIFVDGGFHAREWISPAAAIYIIDQLVEEYEQNKDLFVDYDWVFLPVVNADGYEYTQTSAVARIWRKTRSPHEFMNETYYGTDPNRNFDYHWNEGGASSLPISNTYAGPYAFSESETTVVRDIMHSLAGRGAFYLTLHSYGRYLLYPWGWTADLPDTIADLDEVAQAGGEAMMESNSAAKYIIGTSTNALYIASGTSNDYAYVVGFPISITMELPGGGVTGFDPPESKIDEFVKETWIGVRAMARKVLEKYPLGKLQDLTPVQN